VLHPYTCGFLLVGTLVILGGLGESDSLALAASAKAKKDAKPPVVYPLVPEQQVSGKLPKGDAKPPVSTESSKSVTTVAKGQKPSKHVPRKGSRHQKVEIERPSLTVIEPKPDLSYHGILEQPQRYDPSRDRRAGRAPNPQAGEILHDHFQELDKNHDGMIDPFERAFGRLDMNRDVSNYQWEYPPAPRKTPLRGPANRPKRRTVAKIFRTGFSTSWSDCRAFVEFRVVQTGNSPPPQYCGIPREYLSFPLSGS
jgi:hypothetical protein